MKRALLSVYDKVGIVEFADELVKRKYEIVSTGGTYRTLKDKGIPVTYISEVTDFPEILDGRVKTLHPKIHGGILAKDTSAHVDQLTEIGGRLIDIVAVNLYPFEAVSQNPDSTFDEVLENIDIGGPCMLRAAAKNHPRVVVACDPRDYSAIIDQLQSGEVAQAFRRTLAAKAFAHTAYYDTLITQYLDQPKFPHRMTIALQKSGELRYGENPHQSGAFYQQVPVSGGVAVAKQLQGKALSFNNIMDADAAWQMVSNFEEPCAVAVKHNNPCGLGVAENLLHAYQKAYEGDTVSIFGGIVACNQTMDKQTALAMKNVFLEVVIAPDFTEDALAILKKKPNLRVLKLAPMVNQGDEWKKVTGGVLIQEGNTLDVMEDQLQVVTKRQPTDTEWEDLRFAWKTVKFVKSNGIVLCKDNQLIGVGTGQLNRLQSVKLSLEQAGQRAEGAALASDAFFPFADNIEAAASSGVTAIIQPGGSIRDSEVIELCDQFNMTMIFTGIRHFRH